MKVWSRQSWQLAQFYFPLTLQWSCIADRLITLSKSAQTQPQFFFFLFLHVWYTVNKDVYDQFFPLCNVLLHQPSAGMYSLPLQSGLSLLLALTTQMWQKGSGPFLGWVLRVSAFSLEEASYHVRNLKSIYLKLPYYEKAQAIITT